MLNTGGHLLVVLGINMSRNVLKCQQFYTNPIYRQGLSDKQIDSQRMQDKQLDMVDNLLDGLQDKALKIGYLLILLVQQ